MYESRCTLVFKSTIGYGPSKKEAKQEAVLNILSKLNRIGFSVPKPWGKGTGCKITGMGGLWGLKAKRPKAEAEPQLQLELR